MTRLTRDDYEALRALSAAQFGIERVAGVPVLIREIYTPFDDDEDARPHPVYGLTRDRRRWGPRRLPWRPSLKLVRPAGPQHEINLQDVRAIYRPIRGRNQAVAWRTSDSHVIRLVSPLEVDA